MFDSRDSMQVHDRLDDSSLKSFKYFLECYFNISANYSELGPLVLKFKESEPREHVEQFKKELQLISNSNNWKYIENFFKKYGMREPGQEKLKNIIKTIQNNINDSKNEEISETK